MINVLFTFTLVTGLYASFEDRPKIGFGIVVGILSVFLTLITSWTAESLMGVKFLFVFVFVGYVCYVIIKKVVRSKAIDFNIIAGSISVYLLLAILFSFVFSLLDYYDPEAFHFPDSQDIRSFDFIYFSYVTITTLGYGDISPVTPLAKSLSYLLALTGQLYLTILVAILVSKYGGWKKLQQNDDES